MSEQSGRPFLFFGSRRLGSNSKGTQRRLEVWGCRIDTVFQECFKLALVPIVGQSGSRYAVFLGVRSDGRILKLDCSVVVSHQFFSPFLASELVV